jgi:hypothetical protein
MLHLVKPDSPALWAVARRLIEEYAAALNIDLCFQDFAHEVATGFAAAGAARDNEPPRAEPGGALRISQSTKGDRCDTRYRRRCSGSC